MVDRNASAETVRRTWMRSIAVGAMAAAIVATLLAPGATAGTRADAVITALALEQGRHCVVTRGPGARVSVRGDACDGRRFIRAILALLALNDADAVPLDLDLDIDVKTLDGFHGESMRDVTLRLSVQRGAIAAFALAAKLGDGDVSGRLTAAANRRPAIAFAAGDAGAFLRWSDLYRGARGGTLSVAINAPAADGAVDGVVSLRTFTIADDPAFWPLARLLSDRRRPPPANFAFARLRVAFKSQAGRLAFSDGMVIGELIGATLGGSFDLARDRLDLRGVLVPLVQSVQIEPIFFSLDAGLIGADYAISGSPSAPVLRIEPLRTLAPGFLRQLFEFSSRERSLEP